MRRVEAISLVSAGLLTYFLLRNRYFSLHFYENGAINYSISLVFVFIGILFAYIALRKFNLLKFQIPQFIISLSLVFFSNNLIYILLYHSTFAIYIHYLILLIAGFVLYASAIKRKFTMVGISVGIFVYLVMPKPDENSSIPYFQSQESYYDPVIFSAETSKQQIDITRWRSDYWVYTGGKNQFSTADLHMYYEPMALSGFLLKNNPGSILILGGENGLLADEILKYYSPNIDILPYDPEYLEISSTHPIFTTINNNSLNATNFLSYGSTLLGSIQKIDKKYGIIFMDLPDLDDDRRELYSEEFFLQLKNKLRGDGVLITQSGNPYTNEKGFQVIGNTLKKAGFINMPLHNQVPSIGEWSWQIGFIDSVQYSKAKRKIYQAKVPEGTVWLNEEAFPSLFKFGKSGHKY